MIIINPDFYFLYDHSSWSLKFYSNNKTFFFPKISELIIIIFRLSFPLSKNNLIMELIRYGLMKKEAEQMIYKLLEIKILVYKDYQMGNFINERKEIKLISQMDAKFIDYSNSRKALLSDKCRMMRLIKKESPPSINVIYKTHYMGIPHPATTKRNSFFDAISHLIYFGFGSLCIVQFHKLFPVHLKCSPSNGARHPFEAYLIWPQEDDLFIPGLFHYQSKQHALGKIEDIDFIFHPRIIITCNIERSQWRYRNSWYYTTLLLELGHILENINLIAREYGLNIEVIDIDSENLKSFKFSSIMNDIWAMVSINA